MNVINADNIQPGDYVAYPTNHGGRLQSQVARVEALREDKAQLSVIPIGGYQSYYGNRADGSPVRRAIPARICVKLDTIRPEWVA